jgi:ABC-2 type transport system ATP-binding protein
MHEMAIEVRDLSYRYGDLLAVDGISFSVGRGEVLGFLGPNGAGKSTTIKMLTGQLRPVSGQAVLLGMDVTKEPNKVQGRIGISFEATNLYEQMSAIENLNLFAQLHGIRPFDAQPLLDRVGLGGRGKERASGYSKGMKQRLMVARALVNRPDILFLDEPTEGLDPASSQAIRRIIQEEKARGATVFLTTHDMHEADLLSDRVAFINDGRIEALDTPYNLKQKHGQRFVKAEVKAADGSLETRRIILDTNDTGAELQKLFSEMEVVTVHSEEASLEDIFLQITGSKLI